MRLVVIMGLLLTNSAMGDMESTIKKLNPKLSIEAIRSYTFAIRKYSVAYNVDPKLVAAVIAVESTFKEKAVGTSGEIGLMQLHPKFHANYIENIEDRKEHLFDIDNNVATGTKYIKGLSVVFGPIYGDRRFVEHFNRGPNVKCKTFPYYEKVMVFYRMFGGEIEQPRRTVKKTYKRPSRDGRHFNNSSKAHIADTNRRPGDKDNTDRVPKS